MPCFKYFIVGFLSITTTLATPVSVDSSKVRRAPIPSSYPLGTPHTNEWQYLNFQTGVTADETHLRQLHNAMGLDMNHLLDAGEKAVSAVNKIYLRYFPRSDDEDDVQNHVSSVYNMLGNGNGLLPLVRTFTVDNRGKKYQFTMRTHNRNQRC